MFKKKCLKCGGKISKSDSFCSSCGVSLKKEGGESGYGMLGKRDVKMQDPFGNDLKLPFGFNKIFNNLVKQLEKQMDGVEMDQRNTGAPKGFKIRFSTGNPNIQTNQIMQENNPTKIIGEQLSEKERVRRAALPRINAESRVKRLGDNIIYEIEAAGIKNKNEVVITELATGIEVRAYTKDKCYMKTIPLKVEIISYSVKKDKVVLELKG